METPENSPRVIRTYGNWRRPASAGLLGLGSVGTGILLVGLITVVIIMMTGGLLAATATAAVLALVLGLMVLRDQHGKNSLSKISERTGWWMTRSRGANVFRSGPLGRIPWGTHQLPGLASPIRLTEHTDNYGQNFAVLYAPSTAHFTAVIGTEPSGVTLVDPDQADAWVAEWGHWLASLSDEMGLEGVSVTIETVPDTGIRLRREVEMNTDARSPEFARRVLNDLVARYPAGSSHVRAYVALTYTANRQGGLRRSKAQMLDDLGARLHGLTQSLQFTGAGSTRLLTAQELCEVVRVAYDPEAAPQIEDLRAQGGEAALLWHDVGPASAQANWSSYRHDSGHSVTWSMTGAPRGNIQSGLLGRLLAPHRDIIRKRVTLLYRPLPAARAAAIVEADLRNAEFRATANTKVRARDMHSVRAASATAHEEANGAGLVNFGLLVTATVNAAKSETAAASAIENLGASSRLRLRRVYGSQDSAFAANLPLGLVLPRHIKIPAELRNNI